MPNTSNAGRFGRLGWLWLTVLVLVIDLTSKVYFANALQMYQQIVVIPDLFSWTLAYNTGAAFSFLANAGGWQKWFFTVLAFGISGLMAWMLSRTPRNDWKQALPLALVVGGAIGNVIDRLVHGHVVDFIQWHWKDVYYYPSFNIADSAIVCGAIALLLMGLFGDRGKAAGKGG